MSDQVLQDGASIFGLGTMEEKTGNIKSKERKKERKKE